MSFFGSLFGGDQRDDIQNATRAAKKDVKKGRLRAIKALDSGYKTSSAAINTGYDSASDLLRPLSSINTGDEDVYNQERRSVYDRYGSAAPERLNINFQPVFDASQKWGQQAVERSAAARGHATSPRLLQELQDYGSRTYMDDYMRFADSERQNFTANQNAKQLAFQRSSDYLDRLERGVNRGKDTQKWAIGSLADLATNRGTSIANIATGRGKDRANIETGAATSNANLNLGQGQSVANTRFTIGDLGKLVGDAAKAAAAFG